MIVIGLGGAMGAGKDTVADYLVAEYGFEKFAFADELKHMVAQLDPIIDNDGTRLSHVTREFSKGQRAEMEAHLKRHFPEYRRVMQVLGTECIRNRDKEFWVNRVRDQLLALPDGARVVVSDCRFGNEAEAVILSGDWYGEVWEVFRPGLPAIPASAHSSEAGISEWRQGLILNKGSLAELYAEVDAHLATFPVGKVERG